NCVLPAEGFPRSRGYYCGEVLDAEDLPVTLMTELFPNGGGVERETTRAALTLEYEFGGGATLTSLTGWSEEDQATETDVTYGNYNPGGFWRIEGEERDALSQELRLESSPEGRFHWLLGAYYFDGSDDDVRQDQVLADGSLAPNLAAPLNEFEIENRAIFGSVDYDFTDKLTATLELRYAEDEITQNEFPQTGAPTRTVSDTFYSTSPRAIVSYRPTDESNIYLSYAQGNKPGTFNSGIASLAGAPEAVDEEESDNYEIGGKVRMLDGRLSMSTAFYYIDWTNQQLTQNIFVQTPQGPVANSFVENVGESEVTGFEIEVSAILTDNWDLQFGWSYTDAKIVSYFNQDQADLTSPNSLADLPTAEDRQADLEQYGDVSGQRLPRTPEHQGFLVTTYRVPFGSDFEWFLSGDVTYEGSKFAQVHNLAETGDRTYFGLRTGFENRNWSVILWGKNLTDDTTPTDILRYIDGRGIFPPFLGFRTRGFALSLPRGRQVGLTASYRF
ncbi:MAG TPA: TonB-dependent receptor, partial [Steroidobacteraceae bacterium]|nr:TonB-dependent receptor [Steroidobacteraceae bacterium]